MAAKARFAPPPFVPLTGNGGVSPAWLEAQRGSTRLRILDVRHDGALVPLDVRGSLFDASHTVVVVGDGPGAAANDAVRALFRYGHRDVHLLEGGFSRWIGEGRGVSYELVRHAPASFTARVPT